MTKEELKKTLDSHERYIDSNSKKRKKSIARWVHLILADICKSNINDTDLSYVDTEDNDLKNTDTEK